MEMQAWDDGAVGNNNDYYIYNNNNNNDNQDNNYPNQTNYNNANNYNNNYNNNNSNRFPRNDDNTNYITNNYRRNNHLYQNHGGHQNSGRYKEHRGRSGGYNNNNNRYTGGSAGYQNNTSHQPAVSTVTTAPYHRNNNRQQQSNNHNQNGYHIRPHHTNRYNNINNNNHLNPYNYQNNNNFSNQQQHRSNYHNNQRCYSFIHRNQNQNDHTLQEIPLSQAKQPIDTIDLDKYVLTKRQYKQTTIEIVSQYTNNPDLAKLIYEICYNDNDYKNIILIPNTFNRNEFLKYWFTVNKGEDINEFRDKHRVDLYSDYISLIRRGSIATIKGYKPSKTAKLKLECRFIFRDKRDCMRISLRSNGVREPHIIKWAAFGEVYSDDELIAITGSKYQKSRYPNRLHYSTKDDNGTSISDYTKTAVTPINEELCIIMIDDGDKTDVEYRMKDNVYKIQFNSSKVSKYYRCALYGEFLKKEIIDIKKIELSVIAD